MTKNGREQIGDFRRTSGESRNRGVSFEGQTVAEVSMKTSLRNGSLALQSASLGARLPLLLARRDDLGHVEGLDYRLRARRGLLADCTSEIAQACEDRFIRAEGLTVREQPTFFSRMLMDEKEDAVPRRIVSYRIVSYRIVPETLAAQLRQQCRLELLDAHAVGHLDLDWQLDTAVPADQGDVRFLLTGIMRFALDGT
jgi:hypothetical protein